ncbi:hypothetical protein B0H17DRAFT_500069 [Mycena rosella]|uniref:Uncharacterized protein n=1 Tax=Mycena rosella TaxID=1033263 RepID=A0AAD7DLZ3_MYCRO|nr:hypothetical protein B0H17DRAFT_500069 [Mycena rosella]
MPFSPETYFVNGLGLMYFTFTLVFQTFFFGGYTVLIVLSTRISLKRGLKTTSNKTLFIVGLFMYILSAAYWVYSIVDVAIRMQNYIDPANPGNNSSQSTYRDIFNALILVNYVLSDGIVIWRAWVICARDHRKYIYISIAFFLFTATIVPATIGLRIADLVNPRLGPRSSYIAAINILQVSNAITSFISNLTATALIGATAWRHRQRIKLAFRKKTKANKILILLLETGLFYCISVLTAMVAMLIRLPHGTVAPWATCTCRSPPSLPAPTLQLCCCW